MRRWLAWAALAALIAVTVAEAAVSPLLAWRQPVYIAAGFAGIAGLCLMLLQPLLAGGLLPGLSAGAGRRAHRLIGPLVLASVLLHVAGLWLTSPPDVIDALTFTSPTPFSPFGVVAMWALVLTAILARFRRRLRFRTWRRFHGGLGAVIVAGTILHVALIEGTMGQATKLLICMALLCATAAAFAVLRIWSRHRPQRL